MMGLVDSCARGGNNAAEAEAEHGRDDEESGLALGREKTDHGNKAAKPSDALVRAAEAAGMEALGCEADRKAFLTRDNQ